MVALCVDFGKGGSTYCFYQVSVQVCSIESRELVVIPDIIFMVEVGRRE